MKILKFGFTLAEVLITLGIIGVVAELTIPTIIKDTNESEYNSGAKEALSQFSQAIEILQNSDHGYEFVDSTHIQNRDALCEVMSCIQKDSVANIFGATSGNILSGYKNYKSSNGAYVDIYTDDPSAILKNGMLFAPTRYIADRTYIQLYVDINGKKGPNMFGKDFLLFEITKTDSGKFVLLASGASNGHYAHGTCQTGQEGYWTVWPCSALRVYNPQDLP